MWKTTIFAALMILIAREAQSGGAMQNTTSPTGDRRYARIRHTNLANDVSYISTRFQKPQDWKRRAADLREQILGSAGLLPMPPKAPLAPRIFGRIKRADYTIEKVYFESHPGFYVTGNLYRPNGKGPFPAVVIPHGHSENGRLTESDDRCYPGLCINFAKQGYVAFAYDTIGYVDNLQLLRAGEDAGALHCNGSERSMRTLSTRKHDLWGISMGGLQLWNSIRAVDFVESLPDVDKSRIACTGHSGGGSQTFLLCAVDDRVTVSAPVVMISAHMQGGCRCENIPNMRIDTNNVEIASLTAPRPMIMVSATGDWTRDTPRVEFPAVQHIYALLGANDKVSTVQFDAPHNYNKNSREAVYSMFGQWLPKKPLAQRVPEPEFQVEKAEDLRVFPDGKLPANALDAEALTAQLIHDSDAQLRAHKPMDAASLDQFRLLYSPALRHALSLTEVGTTQADQTGQSDGAGYTVSKLLIRDASRGVEIPATLFTPDGSKRGEAVLMAYAKGSRAFAGGDDKPGNLASELLGRGRRVLLVDCFGTGKHTAPEGSPARNVDADFFETYNRTDAAECVYDVLVAADYLSHRKDVAGVSVVGMGEAGLWCLLARPFAPEIRRMAADVAALDATDDESFTGSLYIPCLRRAGDFRTAMALSAPRELFVLNTSGKFDTSWAAAAYSAAGHIDALRMDAHYPSDSELAQWITE